MSINFERSEVLLGSRGFVLILKNTKWIFKMNQFNYLYSAGVTLPSETPAQRVLKSFYLTKSKHLIQNDSQMLEEKFGQTQVCQKCNNLWSSGANSVSFRPKTQIKSKNRRKYRKLVIKYYRFGLKNGRFSRLTNYLAQKICRKIIYKCTLCSKRHIFYVKPEKKETSKEKLLKKPPISPVLSSKEVKKKKNKKAKEPEKKLLLQSKQKSKKPKPSAPQFNKKNPQKESTKTKQNNILKLAQFLQQSKSKPSVLSKSKLNSFLK